MIFYPCKPFLLLLLMAIYVFSIQNRLKFYVIFHIYYQSWLTSISLNDIIGTNLIGRNKTKKGDGKLQRNVKRDTRSEIILMGCNMFLEKGYTNTSTKVMSEELGISTGNFNFHFTKKEDLLAVLVEELCDFQWKRHWSCGWSCTDHVADHTLITWLIMHWSRAWSCTDHVTKLIGVIDCDPRYSHINSINDINEHLLKEISIFFQNYKILQNKKVVVKGFKEKAWAINEYNECVELMKKYGQLPKEEFIEKMKKEHPDKYEC